MFGLEHMTKLKNKLEFDCITVNEMLANEKIDRVDFFKTDLEGLDFEILKSAKETVNDALVVQSELRFQPMFIGEPNFVEVCSFMQEMDFELIYIATEVWKYNTQHRNDFRDGRLVWGDFIFFKKLNTTSSKEAFKLVLKQIIIAKSLGLHSHAEFLYEKHIDLFPAEILQELSVFMKPKFSLPIKLVNTVAKIKGYGLVRNFFRKTNKLFAVDVRSFKWWTN